MKFCQDHWDRLRAAIDARGLSHLTAPDGETALAQVKQELEQGPSAVTFDPLMGAHWAIVNNVMDLVGLALMAPNEDGTERCPLCFLNAEHERHCTDPACKLDKERGYDQWIERAADDMKAQAERLEEGAA